MNAQEKRLANRVDCSKLVYIRCIDCEGQVEQEILGHILNISKNGLRVESPLPIDTELVLVSTLDAEEKSVGIRSRIVYTQKKESSGFIIGIKFDAPQNSCTNFIRAVAKASRSPLRPQAKVTKSV